MPNNEQPAKGPTVVTITATGPVHVIVENIVDGGRERHENGRTAFPDGIVAGRHFIVGPEQSIRVVDASS